MFNKESCRGCGFYLTPIATCNICREYVSWICSKCDKLEDCFHSHNYCRISLSKNIDPGFLKLVLIEAMIKK
jgi:hypothetical protein